MTTKEYKKQISKIIEWNYINEKGEKVNIKLEKVKE